MAPLGPEGIKTGQAEEGRLGVGLNSGGEVRRGPRAIGFEKGFLKSLDAPKTLQARQLKVGQEISEVDRGVGETESIEVDEDGLGPIHQNMLIVEVPMD